MPEKLEELTDTQQRLLDLLLLEENRTVAASGNWTSLAEQAGYAPGTSRAGVLRSKIFRDELQKRMGEYFIGLQFQAMIVQDDIMVGKNFKPTNAVQLSAAKDVLDRSKNFVKRSETKVDSDMPTSVILLPQKEEIEE